MNLTTFIFKNPFRSIDNTENQAQWMMSADSKNESNKTSWLSNSYVITALATLVIGSTVYLCYQHGLFSDPAEIITTLPHMVPNSKITRCLGTFSDCIKQAQQLKTPVLVQLNPTTWQVIPYLAAHS
jgi:ABC-type antimicrobial peptide transport system ATPase subunit